MYEARFRPDGRPPGSKLTRRRGGLEFGTDWKAFGSLPQEVLDDPKIEVRTVAPSEEGPGTDLQTTEPAEPTDLRPERVQLEADLAAARARIAELEALLVDGEALAATGRELQARVAELEASKADLLVHLEARDDGEFEALVEVDQESARAAVEAALDLVGELPLRRALSALGLPAKGSKGDLVARYASHLLPPRPEERPPLPPPADTGVQE